MKKNLLLFVWLLASSLFAGSINDVAKNPSMAVYSNTALANKTTVPFIPVAVSGAVCDSATDTIAITSDHSSQLICQSGSWVAVGGLDTALKASNGYTRLPSGLIIQWGVTPVIGIGGVHTVTFPSAFPTTCVNISISRVEATTANSFAISTGYPSKTAVTVYSNGARAGQFYWTAIGY